MSKLHIKALFYSFFYQRRFVEAIAIALKHSQRFSPSLSYCYYRLGLYRSAVNMEVELKSKQSTNYYLSQAVSHAACGNEEKSIFYINHFRESSPSKKQYIMLIRGVGNHYPDIAFDILKSVDKKHPVMLSLFCRLNKTSNALNLSNEIDSLHQHNSSFLLIKSNLVAKTPLQQINTINAIYKIYNLSNIQLSNDNLPLSTKNIAINNSHTRTSGPLVTILMTAFNSAERITYSLQSLLAQTYKNIEVIVIDDSSTDNTLQIVKSLSEQDSRIRIIPLSKNVGTYVAKNLGFQYAKGEFVTCHDSDDWAHPEKIERQVTPLINNRRLMCTTSLWIRLQDDGKFYSRQVYPYIRLNPASPLFRRSNVIQEAGLWDCVKTGADSEFLARLKLVFGKNAVVQISLPLALGSHHENSLMTSKITGYNQNNISKSRLDYSESWGRWHIQQIAQNKKPKMPDMLSTQAKNDKSNERPFLVPPELVINAEHIRQVLSDTIS